MDMIENLMLPPTDTVSTLPVTTNHTVLPFQDLSWADFEKFCFQLGSKEMECLETAYLYGRNGQKQDGIDIYFRKDRKNIVWQIKRYDEFKAADVSNAVEVFLNGKWVDNASSFTLCVSNYLDDTAVVDEIDRQSTILDEKNISFAVYNSDKLTILSQKYPDLVRTFFGEAWYKKMFPDSNNTIEQENDTKWVTNTGVRLDPDKIYERGDFKLKVDKDLFYIEETLPDGSATHVILNTKTGATQIQKPPYPFNEYRIIVNPNMYLRKEEGTVVINEKTYYVLKIHLKWGKSAVFYFDESGLVDFTIDCKTFINHSNKTINILDITGETIKL